MFASWIGVVFKCRVVGVAKKTKRMIDCSLSREGARRKSEDSRTPAAGEPLCCLRALLSAPLPPMFTPSLHAQRTRYLHQRRNQHTQPFPNNNTTRAKRPRASKTSQLLLSLSTHGRTAFLSGAPKLTHTRQAPPSMTGPAVPTVLWAQRKKTVFITIDVQDAASEFFLRTFLSLEGSTADPPWRPGRAAARFSTFRDPEKSTQLIQRKRPVCSACVAL